MLKFLGTKLPISALLVRRDYTQEESIVAAVDLAKKAARERKRGKLLHLHATIRELSQIVKGEQFQFLAHLLDMAYIESGDLLRALNSPLDGERE
ncbi:hypothetical protein [Mesorhizobium sp. CN2-181]|uniref:hypothetical protein n=1 Tax=Mesorhizobium yinganensis TaxID=3157707 RepID=UPI0032B7437A